MNPRCEIYCSRLIELNAALVCKIVWQQRISHLFCPARTRNNWEQSFLVATITITWIVCLSQDTGCVSLVSCLFLSNFPPIQQHTIKNHSVDARLSPIPTIEPPFFRCSRIKLSILVVCLKCLYFPVASQQLILFNSTDIVIAFARSAKKTKCAVAICVLCVCCSFYSVAAVNIQIKQSKACYLSVSHIIHIREVKALWIFARPIESWRCPNVSWR